MAEDPGTQANCNADKVKETVGRYLTQPGGGPPVLDLPTNEHLLSLQHSLCNMVSRVMTDTVSETTVKDVERHIKIFLSLYDRFDRRLAPKKKSQVG